MHDSMHQRLVATMERARRLARETRELVIKAQVSAHAARNTRHHAGLIRAILKLTRVSF